MRIFFRLWELFVNFRQISRNRFYSKAALIDAMNKDDDGCVDESC